jgi:hypothetical protein
MVSADRLGRKGRSAKMFRRVGHSIITFTFDRYGHWFADDAGGKKPENRRAWPCQRIESIATFRL